jgi:predicted type IV restriction endonuclease
MLHEAIRSTENQIAYARSKGIRFDEANTKKSFIEPIIEALGWKLRDFEEVTMEYGGNVGGRGADKPVDYALFIAGSPALFVEAKPLDESLDDKRWIDQTLNYANVSGVRWCVLTNGLEYRIYKTHEPVIAVKKLFRSVMIGRDDASVVAATLSLLRKEEMKESSLDRLWRIEVSDRCVREAAEQLLSGDERFVKLLMKVLAERDEGPERKTESLDRKAVLQSLNRLRPRFDDGFPSLSDGNVAAASVCVDVPVEKTQMMRLDQGAFAENFNDQRINCSFRARGGVLKAEGVFDVRTKNVTILAGAVVARVVTEHAPQTTTTQRTDLTKTGKLVDATDGTLLLNEDFTFRNPSAAACFVTGSSINGWDVWMLSSGASLQSIRRKT